jgi:hypothetical protein
LAIGHHASDEVLITVERATGLKSGLVLPAAEGEAIHRLASDPTVPSYDDPQPDPPTVPSADQINPPGPPTVPSYDN